MQYKSDYGIILIHKFESLCMEHIACYGSLKVLITSSSPDSYGNVSLVSFVSCQSKMGPIRIDDILGSFEVLVF